MPETGLARAIGADKTRIIGTLDALQEAGLISREPDPDDRRVRLLEITEAGRHARRSVRHACPEGKFRVLRKIRAGGDPRYNLTRGSWPARGDRDGGCPRVVSGSGVMEPK